MRPAAAFLVVLGTLSILTLLHIHARSAIEGVRFLEYYKDAYEFGTLYRQGGGMLGALLAYPSLLLIGKVGAYILFIACILVTFLVLTKLSIKHAGEKLGATIKTGVDHMAAQREQRKAELYTEALAQKPAAKRTKAVDAVPERPMKRRNKAAREAEALTIGPEMEPAGNPNAVRNAEGELAFMPTSGAIERKRRSPLHCHWMSRGILHSKVWTSHWKMEVTLRQNIFRRFRSKSAFPVFQIVRLRFLKLKPFCQRWKSSQNRRKA